MATLLVSPYPDDHSYVAALCASAETELQIAPTLRDAQSFLETSGASLIICERDLDDGTWKDALASAAGLKNHPPVIAISRLPMTDCGLRCSNGAATT